MYIKGKSWEHEKEYRIVVPIKNQKGENYDVSRLGLSVKRIIAGVNCSPHNINTLNTISKKLGLGNAYKSRLSNKVYGIEIDSLPD